MRNPSVEIVRFCAEEVQRQGRGPIQVADMVDAWLLAMRAYSHYPSLKLIQNLGHLVEPLFNDGGWRNVGVRVGDHVAPHPAEVSSRMERWFKALPDMTPAEAYREFEEVHPFRDGNGRVGKIVFNFLNKTLEKPTMPPNFFGCLNY